MLEKIVVVTRKTRLEELIERFNSRGQARFYIEHSGSDFDAYEREHDTYHRALAAVRKSLDRGLKVQFMERAFVSTYMFGQRDLVITLGQDGLVANTAKYVGSQPIIAINPDPSIYDGILLPFGVKDTQAIVDRALSGQVRTRPVTLAEACLNDGQRLLAFNDLFIGPQSHVSARYRLTWQERSELQSSSGILVSTGAGSTGWLSSLFNMAEGIAAFTGATLPSRVQLPWDDPRLAFIVREPFKSRHSEAELVAGMVSSEEELILESTMPSGGVIFSDGVESDRLPFNSGTIAKIRAARQKACLVVPGNKRADRSRRGSLLGAAN